MGKRREPRKTIEVPVRIFGTDSGGKIFSETVTTLDMSRHGAKLRGVRARVKELSVDHMELNFFPKNDFQIAARPFKQCEAISDKEIVGSKPDALFAEAVSEISVLRIPGRLWYRSLTRSLLLRTALRAVFLAA